MAAQSYKPSHAHGVANLSVLQRLSDLTAAGPAGSEQALLARELLADAGTRVVYTQPGQRVQPCTRAARSHQHRGRAAAASNRFLKGRGPLLRRGASPAEMCGVTHKTARRVVERAHAGSAVAERVVRRRNYESVRALVATEIKDTHGKISEKRLLPKAVAAGYEGSGRNFRRLIAQERSKFKQSQAIARTRRPAVWSPGEHLVLDWGVLGGCTCSALSWPGRGAGSCGSPITSAPTRPCACSRSASRSSMGFRRSCSLTGWAA